MKRLRLGLIWCIFLVLPASLLGAEFLPSISEPIEPNEWLVVGPFSVGIRGKLVDPLIEHGGEENIVPYEGMTHSSVMATGGEVQWYKVEAKDCEVEFGFDWVDWKALQEHHGWPGLANVSYAYTTFTVDEESRALVETENVGTFYLNGIPYNGDPYRKRFLKVPVTLKQGENHLLVRVGAFEEESFKLRIAPAPNPVEVLVSDVTAPDLIMGDSLNSWVGIPIVNTTRLSLKDLRLTVGDGTLIKKAHHTLKAVAPLSIQKVPIPFVTQGEVKGEFEDKKVNIPIEVTTAEWIVKDTFLVRVRERGESFKVTFISAIDSSVQYYAVLPPKDYTPDKEYALILTCHGAGVEAAGQVNAYTPKDWSFIVAPTNRRPFGFDWQDWGRLDALEVIDDVKHRYPIDDNRVYLTGHSMGGHGTWAVGLQHPDLFAAIAPSAGWTSFTLYVPYILRKGKIFASPQLWNILERSLREEQLPAFVENALNLPVYVLQGEKDESVPSFHPRLMVQTMKKLGYEVEYKEVAGKGHWWDEEDIEGTACVNWPELMSFLREKVRNPYPRHVIYRTADIGLNNKVYWIRIDSPEQVAADSRIEAQIEGNTLIVVKLVNIKRFTLLLNRALVPFGRLTIAVNGQNLYYDFKEEGPLTISKRGDKFIIAKHKPRKLEKNAKMFGPIKQGFFSPFVLVYGTRESADLNLHIARLVAQRWYRRGNGYVRIIPDTSVDTKIIKDYNLVLIGNPKTNTVWNSIDKRLPIKVEDHRILLNKNIIKGNHLGTIFVYPNPLNTNKFVVCIGGTDSTGIKLTRLFSIFYAGEGLPDFLVFDNSIRLWGWAGIKAAGFFDNNWNLSKDSMYLVKGQ